ncbi:MAG TPA: hypothetical protein VGI99_09060 [Gemmataceae bacterium]
MRRLAGMACLLGFGCGTATPPPATHREAAEPTHSHERDKMKLADLGKNHHAGLTAHLSSKTGNELDIFIESADDAHTPAPLPVAKLLAEAVASDGKAHELIFEPSEPEERKGDPPGKCSHFVAKAPWMKPGDSLTVTAGFLIDGQTHSVEWTEFNPKKYAHFEE